MFCSGVSLSRSEVRAAANIDGHPMEDFLFSLFLYPSVALQLEIESQSTQHKKNEVRSWNNEGFKA